MFDILSIIPSRKKQTNSGWYSFNAICCQNRGHRPDKRYRGGIKPEGNNWVMHCFNCGFSCSFTLGKSISPKTKSFLKWCGVDEEEIQKWSLESLKNKSLLDFIEKSESSLNIKFKETVLPQNSILLDKNDRSHQRYIDYLKNRKIDIDRYKFYITPNDKLRNSNRIIIPYYYKNKLVGNTSRYLDNRTPKYINDQQQGYVFNLDMQKNNYSVCIVTEGSFDAMSIDGVAVLHDDINNEQAYLLSKLNRKIVVVPDQDKTGLKITERALECGFSVSIPTWGPDVKDVNDAVVKYGKLPTLLSILENATISKIKIEMRKKQIAKGI